MPDVLTASAQKVQKALIERGLTCEVMELPDTTRTAADAASAIGCKVEQIVKSLIFRTAHSNSPILVLASGPNRVNEKKIGEVLSEPLAKADADFVRTTTGYAIGGIPPVGHLNPLRTFIDEDLFKYDELWAAGGTPNAVFNIKPSDLEQVTGGHRISLQ